MHLPPEIGAGEYTPKRRFSIGNVAGRRAKPTRRGHRSRDV
jgi:hypothetical protein